MYICRLNIDIMEIGTKIQMDNGDLGIQEGVIIGFTWCDVVRWDTIDFEDDEELGDNFEHFGGKILSDNWEFAFINDDGSRK